MPGVELCGYCTLLDVIFLGRTRGLTIDRWLKGLEDDHRVRCNVLVRLVLLYCYIPRQMDDGEQLAARMSVTVVEVVRKKDTKPLFQTISPITHPRRPSSRPSQ